MLEARVRSQGPLDCVIFAFLVLVISFGAATQFGALIAASEDHRAKGVCAGKSVSVSNKFGCKSARGVVTENGRMAPPVERRAQEMEGADRWQRRQKCTGQFASLL